MSGLAVLTSTKSLYWWLKSTDAVETGHRLPLGGKV
jgi:hypothetical protein